MNRTSRSTVRIVSSLFVFFVLSSLVSANIKLPHIITGEMVLQRDKPIPIWGWAEPGEQVAVKFAGHQVKTQADAKGDWILTLPATKAGGPYKMTVSGSNTIELSDILIGEVWVCSGQSNMAMQVKEAKNAEEEIAAANYDKIRFFRIDTNLSIKPLSDVNAQWRSCTPDHAWWCSAVGYFFAREIYRELDVPVGLIVTAWGGTRIESWTPLAGFEQVPKLRHIGKRLTDIPTKRSRDIEQVIPKVESWLAEAKKALARNDLVPEPPAWPDHPLNNNSAPTTLYNAMVHPLLPYAIRGAIWYQGEANTSEGMMYHEKMKALIGGWRRVWNQGDFPFYFVQLAPYRYKRPPHWLPGIWEAQTASLSIPNTGMAVIVDLVDNINNIHPKNKQDVGKRLALWALAKTYGRNGLVYSGPLYKSMSVEDNRIRVSFDHVGSSLACRDGKPLNCFEIAGEDKNFGPAKAKIKGNSIVVSSAEVANPVAVRFAWTQDAQPNLMNKEGLPASPFRTDRW